MLYYLLPEKYDFVPNQADIDAAQELLRKLLGKIEIDYWRSEEAQVVGLLTTGNQEISCPVCGHAESFENPAAFGEMLFVQSAETIEFEMPCCGSTVSLAQIDLTPNTKFSRFAFEIISDSGLSLSQLQAVSHALNSQLLVVERNDDE
jgi:hypothetical protein